MPQFNHRPRAGMITPPDSGLMYGNRMYSQGQYGQNRKSQYDMGYEHGQYTLPAPHPVYQQPPMHYNNMPSAPPGLHQSAYGPIAAPNMLPTSNRDDSRSHERRQQPVKEEKIMGGVAAELDYEMDQMTDYVSEMAQSIIMPLRPQVSPPFRKFVAGILSSTRLPSSTILLGLNYLARRMTMLKSTTPPFVPNDPQIWRMLTIALLLGSKFLDDNTFQNRSWSEVSGISVQELNKLELEWLVAVNWTLHVDFFTDEDYTAWLVSWSSWKEHKNHERNATLERLAPLAPIDTNVQRAQMQRNTYSPPNYSSYGAHAAENTVPAFSSNVYEHSIWSHPQPTSDLSPPSAPESGPNTPEWTLPAGCGMPPAETQWYGYNSFYADRRNQRSTQLPYVPAQAAPYHAPYQAHQASYYPHPPGCNCTFCMPTESYFRASGYAQQTVAH